MKKTWGEIRSETLNLGFEKVEAYDKNRQAYIQAYNWAQNLIASTVGKITKQLIIKVDKNSISHLFDLSSLATEQGEEYFSVADTGIVDSVTGEALDNYRLSDNRFLVVPACYDGLLIVHYYAAPKRIDEDSEDETECDLGYKWAVLMPYLMASRLYLDDDAAKAGFYWNFYDDMKNQILMQENKPMVSVNIDNPYDVW